MVTFEELNTQNHKIMELSKVLQTVIQDRALCDNEVTCDLFFQYVDQVKGHLDIEDKHLYAALLNHKERSVNNIAKQFLSGSAEIKRIFETYLHKWCKKRAMMIRDHQAFVNETEDMFRLVLNRIQDETEQLYPLIRKVSGDTQVAA
jgi:hemerythrin-like domain-containing protein